MGGSSRKGDGPPRAEGLSSAMAGHTCPYSQRPCACSEDRARSVVETLSLGDRSRHAPSTKVGRVVHEKSSLETRTLLKGGESGAREM